jgi:hypothetical protein
MHLDELLALIEAEEAERAARRARKPQARVLRLAGMAAAALSRAEGKRGAARRSANVRTVRSEAPRLSPCPRALQGDVFVYSLQARMSQNTAITSISTVFQPSAVQIEPQGYRDSV